MDLTLKQNNKPLYVVQPNQSHPRLSIRRVLYVRVCRWVEKASPTAVGKVLWRTSGVAVIVLAYCLPHFLLGIASAAWSVTGFRLLTCVSTCVAFLYWRQIERFIRRRRPTANAHTFHGVPVDELATYLIEHGFKRDKAVPTLGLSKGRFDKIARTLDENNVTVRDENNGRILSNITREELVRQLRDDFPLAYDPVGKAWVQKRGDFERFVVKREREEQEQKETAARLKKQIKGMKQELRDARDIGFATRCVVA